MNEIDELKKIVAESDNIVFFGGAGVSTESGIPDFRSVDGLYRQTWTYPPETILSHSFFVNNPAEYYRFHRAKLFVEGARPNITHQKLAELEEKGKLKAVITQNIDGLHQLAGSRNVIELHGSILRAYCSKCGKSYDSDIINKGERVPRCTCGGVIRPDIVLYEEPLDEQVLSSAISYIRHADVMIIGGTSLNVYPAAGLVNYCEGTKLVLINRSATPYDSYADLVIHDNLGNVFSVL